MTSIPTDSRGKYTFPNNTAKYAFIRSMWPTHKHKILMFMTVKRLQAYLQGTEYTTISEVVKELGIHKARASADLKNLIENRHMCVDKKRYPYLFFLTKKGMKYGEHIALNHQRYKMDIDQYFIAIARIKRTKHPLYHKFDLTSREEMKYFESLLDALTILPLNDQEVYSGNREEDEYPIPDYLLDEKLDEYEKMKEKYDWDDREYHRFLLRTTNKLKKPKKGQMY